MLQDVVQKAQEVLQKYNPGVIAPFPFEKIYQDEKNLEVHCLELDEEISGSINFDVGSKKYKILINSCKSVTRQYFTLGHELGHFYLHQAILRKEKILIDGDSSLNKSMLFRSDTPEFGEIEFEANQFAANLLMPEDNVRRAWETLGNVHEMADIFKVSVSAISVRLERLGLL